MTNPISRSNPFLESWLDDGAICTTNVRKEEDLEEDAGPVKDLDI
jgi:hypothetical protein